MFSEKLALYVFIRICCWLLLLLLVVIVVVTAVQC